MDGTASPHAETAPRRPLTIALLGYAESTHVRARAQALARAGHRVVWLTQHPARLSGVEEVLLVPADGHGLLYRAANFATRRLGGWSMTPVRLYRRLVEALDELQPDLVNIHYAYSVPAWLAAAADRHPMVVSVMGGDVLFGEQAPTTPLGRWLTLEVLKSADLITAKSNHLISALDRLGGFGEKAIRIVWGVDLLEFAPRDPTPLRQKLGLPADARVILSPKILRPFYNIHLVIDAMAELAPRCPKAVLLLTEYAAEPEYRDQLVKQIARLDLEGRVRFVGNIPVDEMPLFYSLADVVVAVPPSDGLPQALFEAMAVGAPNVLSRLPRYLEVVTDRESVVLVDIEPKAIADGIAGLLDDPALAERIKANGQKIVAEIANLGQEVRRLEDAIYPLLGNRAPARNPGLRALILAGISMYATPEGKRRITEVLRRRVEAAAEAAAKRMAQGTS